MWWRRPIARCASSGSRACATNIGFLQNLLQHPEFVANRIYTRFVEDHIAELVERRANRPIGGCSSIVPTPAPRAWRGAVPADVAPARRSMRAIRWRCSSTANESDAPSPIAATATVVTPQAHDITAPENTVAIQAPMQGTIVSVDVHEGDRVHRGQQLFVMEAMKMEHVIARRQSGIVRRIAVAAGDAVFEGHPLAFIEEGEVETTQSAEAGGRRSRSRAPRSCRGGRAARDGPRRGAARGGRAPAQDRPAHGAREHRRPVRPRQLRRVRPAGDRGAAPAAHDRGFDQEYAGRRDGRRGSARVNGDLFEESQGAVRRDVVRLHRARRHAGSAEPSQERPDVRDRAKSRLPVVFFTEGGGGRPGDTDGLGVAGLDCMAFNYWGKLSGLVPLVGINSGRCFAGNAALLGCCDVVIATADSNIGMGGPAMIEGGGLGVFRPEEVGPMERAGAQRRGRYRGRRRGAKRCASPRSTSRISRAPFATGSAPTSGCCARSFRRIGCAFMTCAR